MTPTSSRRWQCDDDDDGVEDDDVDDDAGSVLCNFRQTKNLKKNGWN